jgi:hypothetical protein
MPTAELSAKRTPKAQLIYDEESFVLVTTYNKQYGLAECIESGLQVDVRSDGRVPIPPLQICMPLCDSSMQLKRIIN